MNSNIEELQYHKLIYEVMETGTEREGRSGKVQSIFAPMSMRFNIGESFPLLTTKKINLRIIFEELMFFIRGQTNSKILHDKKVYIWDANGSREALDKRGLYYFREGDLGPIYGFQWRHFGTHYTSCDTDYGDRGVDQLYNVIESILFNPHDRRIILSAWNPNAIPSMALPPCHIINQFYVSNGELSCQLYQRSGDIGLGIPYNIASYSLLTCMLAHLCGLKPGKFIHVIGDAHIYSNHINALETQVKREPRAFPKLIIKKEIPNAVDGDKNAFVKAILKKLESFEYTDIELIDYNPYPAIYMEMSV